MNSFELYHIQLVTAVQNYCARFIPDYVRLDCDEQRLEAAHQLDLFVLRRETSARAREEPALVVELGTIRSYCTRPGTSAYEDMKDIYEGLGALIVRLKAQSDTRSLPRLDPSILSIEDEPLEFVSKSEAKRIKALKGE